VLREYNDSKGNTLVFRVAGIGGQYFIYEDHYVNVMTRCVTLGNGSLTVMADCSYMIRELYYPTATLNHAEAFRIGIWKGGEFAWIHNLNPEIDFPDDNLSSEVKLKFNGIELEIMDAVDFSYPILTREIKVNGNGEVRIFFAQSFNINGSAAMETAAFDPKIPAVMHYKRDKWFLISSDQVIYQYATGYKETGTLIGTWKDAEDGYLSGNPIAQGSVDSVISFSVNPPAQFHVWLLAGRNYKEVKERNEYVKRRTARKLLNRTKDYWKAWLTKVPQVPPFVKKSLLVLASHWQSNGAVPASLDGDIMKFNRDGYNYVWHRDSAFAAHALTLMGYLDMPRALFDFTMPLLTEDGCLFQKYTCDGHWGSTWHPWTSQIPPIQEDETALMLYVMWEHFARFKDVDYIKKFYRPLIKTMAEFLVRYRYQGLGLPFPSYDLWEERAGVHLFTTAAVYAGLRAAANFAEFFGEEDVKARYSSAAEEVLRGIQRFYTGENFARTLWIENGKVVKVDKTADASTLILPILGVLPIDDPRVVENKKYVESKLYVAGGLARYEGDLYMRTTDKPNAWYITTLWLAQNYALEGNKDKASSLLNWVISKSLKTGLIPEQVSERGDYPSVCPLVWSHAEVIRTYYVISNGKI